MNLPRISIKNIFIKFIIVSFFLFCAGLLLNLSKHSDWHDFEVFYQAATAALEGNSIYVVVGKIDLPFWYPPWTAWAFIPFALLDYEFGLNIYKLLSLVIAILTVVLLARYYQRDIKSEYILLMIACLVPLSVHLINVGQMEYLFLAVILAVIWSFENDYLILGSLLYPFILTKPHLVIPFSIYLFLRVGKKALFVSGTFTLMMLTIQTISDPGWYSELINRFQEAGHRTEGLFITFPSFIGLQNNWLGTANLPITLILIMVSLVILWRYREMPSWPFFSTALAASLFCAPRAFPYDLILLIPALIWLTAKKFNARWWLWLIVCIVPPVISYISISYFVVLLVFGFCIYEMEREFKLGKSDYRSEPIGKF